MKTIEEVIKYLEKEANIEVSDCDHWEWGNYDDSYSLGIDNGYVYCARDLLTFITGITKTYVDKESND